MARDKAKEKAAARQLGKHPTELTAEEKRAANAADWDMDEHMAAVAGKEGPKIEIGMNFDRVLLIPPYIQQKCDEYELDTRWTLIEAQDEGRDLNVATALGWEPAYDRNGKPVIAGRRNRLQLFWISRKTREAYRTAMSEKAGKTPKLPADKPGQYDAGSSTQRGGTAPWDRVS